MNVMDFIADRASGMTFEEIGKKHGVSKQYAHQEICKFVRAGQGRRFVSTKFRYPTLAHWLNQNSMSVLELSKNTDVSMATIYRLMRGLTVSLSTVQKILSFTGLTFEELFEAQEGYTCITK